MPLGWRQIRRGPKHNWTFVTQSEPGCDSRRLSLARGKTPGGYSSINDMLYVRCHSRGYDLWRQAGCEGWSYAKFWFPGLSPRQEHMLEGYPSLNHPESRGDVRLASANPNDPPLIRLNALSTEGDRATGRASAPGSAGASTERSRSPISSCARRRPAPTSYRTSISTPSRAARLRLARVDVSPGRPRDSS